MTDTVDTPISVRKLADDIMIYEDFADLVAGAEMLTRYAALLEQVAAHQKVCAGKWVKVTERLPAPLKPVDVQITNADGARLVVRDAFVTASGEWSLVFSGDWAITHWLDACMPGEEER